ncbi:hypothetical protein D3C75_907660 [compost metagenome]
MRHRVRARANNRHLTHQHIDKLRQFVKRGTAQEIPDRRHTLITFGGLGDDRVVFHHFHGTKFPHLDRLAVHAIARLTEDNRAGRRQFHRRTDTQQHRGNKQQDHRRKHDVFEAFQDAVDTVERRIKQRHNRHTVHFFGAGVQNIEGKHIRDQHHRTGGIRQFANQRFDACFFAHRHRNVDIINASGARLLH